MKAITKTSLLLLALCLATSLNADVLTFDAGPLNGATVPRDFGNGITGSIGFTHSTVGGGHLWLNGWNNDDVMRFATPTHVNSFDITAPRWLNDSLPPTGYKINIVGLDSSNTKVWDQTIDLTGTTWNNWMTITVDTYDITKMIFYGPNNSFQNTLSPSIDNLTLNVEPPLRQQGARSVPDAGGTALIFLMGLGSIAMVSRSGKRATTL